jgi:hypothetical protein
MSLAADSPKPILGARIFPNFVGALIFAVTISVAAATAQQVTGPLGSPNATTTVEGKQLLASPPKFGGVIKESAKDSTPWWPPRAVDETFDIGVDTRTPVDFSYDLPFRFNGKIDKLTYNLGPSQLSAEDQKKVQDAVAKVNN